MNLLLSLLDWLKLSVELSALIGQFLSLIKDRLHSFTKESVEGGRRKQTNGYLIDLHYSSFYSVVNLKQIAVIGLAQSLWNRP